MEMESVADGLLVDFVDGVRGLLQELGTLLEEGSTLNLDREELQERFQTALETFQDDWAEILESLGLSLT